MERAVRWRCVLSSELETEEAKPSGRRRRHAATQSRSFPAASEIQARAWLHGRPGERIRPDDPEARAPLVVVAGRSEREMESGGCQAGGRSRPVLWCAADWLAWRRFLEAGSTQDEGDRWKKDADASHRAPALVPACLRFCL